MFWVYKEAETTLSSIMKKKEEKRKNKYRKEDLNYPAEILCRYFFSQKLSCRKKFQHIVNVKAISESEENLDDKQKAY